MRVSERQLLCVIDYVMRIAGEGLRGGLGCVVTVIASENIVIISKTVIKTNAIYVTGNCRDAGERQILSAIRVWSGIILRDQECGGRIYVRCWNNIAWKWIAN